MKTVKQLLSMMLVICLIVGLATPALATEKHAFVDLDEKRFYYDAVIWAVENDITQGMTDTTFVPEGSCTRGQVVTFLWRAMGEPEPSGQEHPFADVKENAYYYNAMLWAVEQNITQGMTDTTFEPNGVCTRGQVVTFLWRTMGSEKAKDQGDAFNDVASSRYYYDAVLWAVENGIAKGTTDTDFSPENHCTRGHVVTFLYRTLEDGQNKEDEPSTEPSTEATEPSTEATEPSTEATEPSTEATEPSTEPVEPTEPVTEATEPVDDYIFINSGDEIVADLKANESRNYKGRLFGMTMTMSDAKDAAVHYEGKEYKADENGVITVDFPVSTNMNSLVEFTVTASADGTVKMTFSYPVGDMMNPAVLDVGQPGAPLDNKANITQGDLDGYFYTWTAEEAGTLTIEIFSTRGWSYKINNMTTYRFGDPFTSADKPQAPTAQIEVAAGDEIQINVTTFDQNDPFTAPGGIVTIRVQFEPIPGTRNNPYIIKVPSRDPYTTKKLAKGSVTYFVAEQHERQIMRIDNAGNLVVMFGGKEYMPESGSITVPLSTNRPAVFQIINHGAEAACVIAFDHAPGAKKNPIDLGGEETFEAEVNYTLHNEYGIYYTWTAPADGVVTASYVAPEDTTANIIIEMNGEDGMVLPVRKGEKVDIFVCAVSEYGIPVVVDFKFSGTMRDGEQVADMDH